MKILKEKSLNLIKFIKLLKLKNIDFDYFSEE